MSVLSEHVASQSKWQSAELDLLKLAKKRKSVWLALFRGNVRVSSLLNAGVDSKLILLRTGNFKRYCHFRSEVYSTVESEPVKDEVATFEEELNLDKELRCLFWRVKGKIFRITPYIYYACRIIHYVCALLFLKTIATPLGFEYIH